MFIELYDVLKRRSVLHPRAFDWLSLVRLNSVIAVYCIQCGSLGTLGRVAPESGQVGLCRE